MASKPDSGDFPDANYESHRPWQFSIKMLLVLTTCVALLSAMLFVIRDDVAGPLMILFTVLYPALLVIITIYEKTPLRAFSIGALFPSGLLLYVTGWHFAYLLIEHSQRRSGELLEYLHRAGYVDSLRVYIAGAFVLSLVVGFACVGLRAVLINQSKQSGSSTDA
ncbi:MAG: hypothetical protein IH991_13560 [Planctomycetes bacterium]|nr:hypothetical protein [Planctomycetota bacterium]